MAARHPILFISSYVDLGGGETSLLNLARALDPDRFWPHLLVRAEGQLSAAWLEQEWPVHVTHWRGASVYFLPPVWARFPISYRMSQLMRRHDIRVVHSDYHALPMALPAAERAGIPALWMCWGWWFRPKPWQRAFFQRPAATFALSQAIKDGFLGQPPFMPSERVELLYPGVDIDRFHPAVNGAAVREAAGVAPDAPLVALIARFQDVKGHDVFQEMARLVARTLPEARFVVAGENTQTGADNAYRDRILTTARTDPELRERMVYLGFRADAERVMAAADVVVCSSHFESYGMVNVEAMSSGRPVVSTDRGGPAETVSEGETGYLVPPKDPSALADRVIRLLREPDLRQRMGQAGRARVERLFSVQAMAARYAQTLDRLMSSKGAAS